MRTVPSAGRDRSVLTPLAAAIAMAFVPLSANALPSSTVVTNTSDSGPGSLRQVILDANANCGSSASPVISFNIASGPFVIAPSSPLPPFACGTGTYTPTIDGYTQPGAAPNTLSQGFNASIPIVIDGTSAGAAACGVDVQDFGYGASLTVRGLEIRNFTYGGFAAGVCEYLNVFGSRLVNNSVGLIVHNGSTVGSGSAADRNVIAGNATYGIQVAYGGTVSIVNNYVGLLDAASPLANGLGIYLPGGPQGGLISANVVSANTSSGIFLAGDQGTQVIGNFIGTDGSASSAFGNDVGIVVSGGFPPVNTQIVNNVISGNSIGLSASQIDGAQIVANNIGIDGAQAAAVPNGTGVEIDCSSNVVFNSNNVSGNSQQGLLLSGVDASPINFNDIGVLGTGPMPNGSYGIVNLTGACTQTGSHNGFTGNAIAYNGADGILLLGGVGNTISQNQIYANGNKNLDINNTSGPLPNDPGDGDTGPNNQQNYPIITSVQQSGGQTTIFFTLDSTPATFNIEIYSNNSPGIPAGFSYVANTFLPVTSGPASGSFTFGGLIDNISLTATNTATGDTSEFSPMVSVAAAPAVSLSASSLNFGNVAVGATSAQQTSTLTSTGGAPYVINAFDTNAACYGGPICSGGPFICSTSCVTGNAYSSGSSCNFNASFAPNTPGFQSTTVYICDNASGSPRTITLTGNGLAPAPLIISPPRLDFGDVLVGAQSAPQDFGILNSGTVAQAADLSIDGAFVLVATTCPATLSPGGSCAASVAFAPQQPGFASGNLNVGTSQLGGQLSAKTAAAPGASAQLFGNGVQQAQLELPASVDLGAYTLGTPAIQQKVALTNTGNAVLTLSSVTVTDPFTLASDCPANLAPGASCTLTLGFSTTAAGEFKGTLTVVSNARGGSRAIPVTARSQPRPVALLRVAPVTIGYGDRLVGTLSAAQRVTITNEGGAAAVFAGIATSFDYVVAQSNCGATLAPQASCTADIAFRPLGFGLRSGELRVTSNADNGAQSVGLIGTGCRPFIPSNSRLATSSNCAP